LQQRVPVNSLFGNGQFTPHHPHLLSALHWREKRYLITFGQDIITGLVINADSNQGRPSQGGQLWEAENELQEKVFQPGAGRDGFRDLSRTGQVFKVGIKMDSHLHQKLILQEFARQGELILDDSIIDT
jgi:hypothetical protein